METKKFHFCNRNYLWKKIIENSIIRWYWYTWDFSNRILVTSKCQLIGMTWWIGIIWMPSYFFGFLIIRDLVSIHLLFSCCIEWNLSCLFCIFEPKKFFKLKLKKLKIISEVLCLNGTWSMEKKVPQQICFFKKIYWKEFLLELFRIFKFYHL